MGSGAIGATTPNAVRNAAEGLDSGQDIAIIHRQKMMERIAKD